MKLQLTLAAMACLAPSARAQAVLVVDDDGGGAFTTIQAAVDAAAPGDVVLVEGGSYPPFSILGKSVVVHASTDDRPVVSGPVVVQNVGASDAVSIRGLSIREVPSVVLLASAPVLSVVSCDGPVWIEDVSTNDGAPTPGRSATTTLVASSASVSFVRCSLRAGTDPQSLAPAVTALRAFESGVQLYESLLVGGADTVTQPRNSAGVGRPGLQVEGGEVFLSGCDVRGGGGPFGLDFPVCMQCDGGDGGAGLVQIGKDPHVTVVDSTIVGGAGGLADDPTTGPLCFNPSCSDGVDGPDTVVTAGALDRVTDPLRSMAGSSPVRDGETLTVSLAGEPGDLAVSFFSIAQVGAVFLAPTVALGPGFIGAPFELQGLGVLDATGEAELSVPTGGLITGFQGVPLYNQAVYFDAGLFARIGSPTLILFLDPAF